MKPVVLYCFPCSGGSATSYLRWRKTLPGWIQVEPIELPGRGVRINEPLLRDFDELADFLSETMAVSASNEYAVFGHSLGALLAFECVHRLLGKQRPGPRAFFAACSPAPSRRSYERFGGLNGDDALIEELRAHKGTPEEIFEDPEMLRFTLDVLAADFSVCATFERKQRSQLPVPIFVFGGLQDDVVVEDLEAWNLETSGPMTLNMFQGGHFFFKEKEVIFLSQLEADLKKVFAI
jgi:surfactin synthase thioesterase subunit